MHGAMGTADDSVFQNNAAVQPEAGVNFIYHSPDGQWSQLHATDGNHGDGTTGAWLSNTFPIIEVVVMMTRAYRATCLEPVVARLLASTLVSLCGGARGGTHHAEYAILILGRKLQRRESRLGEATVGFDRLEDPAYVSYVRYVCGATQRHRGVFGLPVSSDKLDGFATGF
jgi:hypothetical protein